MHRSFRAEDARELRSRAIQRQFRDTRTEFTSAVRAEDVSSTLGARLPPQEFARLPRPAGKRFRTAELLGGGVLCWFAPAWKTLERRRYFIRPPAKVVRCIKDVLSLPGRSRSRYFLIETFVFGTAALDGSVTMPERVRRRLAWSKNGRKNCYQNRDHAIL